MAEVIEAGVIGATSPGKRDTKETMDLIEATDLAIYALRDMEHRYSGEQAEKMAQAIVILAPMGTQPPGATGTASRTK